MKPKNLINLRIPTGEPLREAIISLRAASRDLNRKDIPYIIRAVIDDPDKYKNDKYFGNLALSIIEYHKNDEVYTEREVPAKYAVFGKEYIDSTSIEQMERACRLPITIRGALMPDAHSGYGLPIGGVLATKGAVIPYAVGLDIACRMKISILNLPVSYITENVGFLSTVLNEETCFGIGRTFKSLKYHRVLDKEDWSITCGIDGKASLKDLAHQQLGTSGSGNHFVEFGIFTLKNKDGGTCEWLQGSQQYVALLSHSGSRGVGAKIARYYSKLARGKRNGLPRELQELSWLYTDEEDGIKYWQCMELMGEFAAANHEIIHRSIINRLKVEQMFTIENHHNFAWREFHDNEYVVVHRKGATPAYKHTFGIIPGSMATPAYIVSGNGNEASLQSASHGAGRTMSRKQAKETISSSDTRKLLKDKGVVLLSGGIDESPAAYKDIDTVMAAQRDLVDVIGQFDPKIVKMDG